MPKAKTKPAPERAWPAAHVEMLPIKSLLSYPRNARTHSPEQIDQIAASMTRWGWTVPVLVDEKGMLICGHGRVLAANKLGIADVPVMVAAGWTEDEKRAYRLADNQIPMNAGWDTDLLKIELQDLKLGGFEVELLGFDDMQLVQFMAGSPTGADPEATPEPPVLPVSRKGDLWLLGEHRVLCGDATSAEDVERLLDGARMDCILTDPPFGINLDTDYSKIKGSEKATIKRAGKVHRPVIGDDRPFDAGPVLAAVGNVREQFWFGGDFYRRTLSASDLDGAYIVWDKRNEASDSIIGSGFELIWSKQKHKRDLLRVFQCGAFGGDSQPVIHPTQKPVKLLTIILERWTEVGWKIFDPFSGSGSTLITCEAVGRIAFASEIDPSYVDATILRWEQFSGKQATLLDSAGQTFAQISDERRTRRLGAKEKQPNT